MQSKQLPVNQSLTRLDKFYIWFSIIDALFLTYLPFVALTVSTPVILMWFITHLHWLSKDKEYSYCLVLLALMLMSIVIGAVLTRGTFVDNIKVFIIQGLGFHYYFMFKYYITACGYKLNVKRWLEAFLLLGCLLAIYYIIDRAGFIALKGVLNRFDGVVAGLGTSDSSFRYNFLWTDANNPPYIFCMVMLFILVRYRNTNLEKAALLIVTLVPILASMSTGGLIAYAASLLILVVSAVVTFFRKKGKIRFSWKRVLGAALIVALFVIFRRQIINFFRDPTISQSIDRTSSNEGQLEYRIRIWKSMLSSDSIFSHIFTGIGPSIVIDGMARKPHNGFLYLIYAYGAVAMFLEFRLLFFKMKQNTWREYLYMLPLWIGFSVNVVIGNPKALIILCLVTAITRFQKEDKELTDERSQRRHSRL